MKKLFGKKGFLRRTLRDSYGDFEGDTASDLKTIGTGAADLLTGGNILKGTARRNALKNLVNKGAQVVQGTSRASGGRGTPTVTVSEVDKKEEEKKKKVKGKAKGGMVKKKRSVKKAKGKGTKWESKWS